MRRIQEDWPSDEFFDAILSESDSDDSEPDSCELEEIWADFSDGDTRSNRIQNTDMKVLSLKESDIKFVLGSGSHMTRYSKYSIIQTPDEWSLPVKHRYSYQNKIYRCIAQSLHTSESGNQIYQEADMNTTMTSTISKWIRLSGELHFRIRESTIHLAMDISLHLTKTLVPNYQTQSALIVKHKQTLLQTWSMDLIVDSHGMHSVHKQEQGPDPVTVTDIKAFIFKSRNALLLDTR